MHHGILLFHPIVRLVLNGIHLHRDCNTNPVGPTVSLGTCTDSHGPEHAKLNDRRISLDNDGELNFFCNNGCYICTLVVGSKTYDRDRCGDKRLGYIVSKASHQ